MSIKVLARQVTVSEGGDGICYSSAVDPNEHVTWYCTLHPGHDGPHVAHYDYENVVVAGLIWEDS